MNNITTYIIEKLHLNKNCKPQVSEEDFIQALDRTGQILLEDIFDDNSEVPWPWTSKGHSMDSIYVVKGKLYTTWHDSYSHIEDIEEEISFDDFTQEQIELIYDYITK